VPGLAAKSGLEEDHEEGEEEHDEAVARVAEHEGEEEGKGDGREDGRVDFCVGGDAVGVDYALEAGQGHAVEHGRHVAAALLLLE